MAVGLGGQQRHKSLSALRDTSPCMAATPSTPHDGLFKKTFGDPQHAVGELRTFLPERIAQRMCIAIFGMENDLAGRGVYNLGDLNSDGADDLLVLAPGLSPITSLGRAYIVYSPYINMFDIESQAAAVLEGETSGERFPTDVAVLGDVDGDGKTDLAFGSNAGNDKRAAVYFVTGAVRGISAVTTVATKTYFGDRLAPDERDRKGFRASLAVGDFDGDGAIDIAVSDVGAQTTYVLPNRFFNWATNVRP